MSFCGEKGVAFSSKKDDWETPQAFFDKLHEEFRFTLDVCASPVNAKVRYYYSSKQDSLAQPWNFAAACWMNPPYGREIGRWMKKAYEEAQKGTLVVCLVPSRTDTRWWHDYVMRAHEIRFVKGRLHFGKGGPAPFPSAVVVFRDSPRRGLKVSSYE